MVPCFLYYGSFLCRAGSSRGSLASCSASSAEEAMGDSTMMAILVRVGFATETAFVPGRSRENLTQLEPRVIFTCALEAQT
uniref:Uncharacterized protein n=1 Tax=Sphaerodactylus townsendi TaxID=933632 RepID=A0ACB8F5J1_9SAUR